MCYANKMFGIKILKAVHVDQFISVFLNDVKDKMRKRKNKI